jgi:hypothetical protein
MEVSPIAHSRCFRSSAFLKPYTEAKKLRFSSTVRSS